MEDVADVYKVSLSSNTSACSTCNLHIDTAGADGLSFNSELDTLEHVGYEHVGRRILCASLHLLFRNTG
jgi:hypothetical protein